MPLTLKQQRFCDAYLGQAAGNATQAARLAGYRGNDVTLRSVGTENLAKPLIQEAIQEATAEAAEASHGSIATADEVLALLTATAHADINDCLDEHGNPSIARARETGATRQIREVRPTKHGLAIKLSDPTKAQELLGKYHGLWSDETSVTVHAGAFAEGIISTVMSVLGETIPDETLRNHIASTLLSRLAGSPT